jgi:hypothetical protein
MPWSFFPQRSWLEVRLTRPWRETDSNHRSLAQETGRFGGNAKTFEGRRGLAGRFRSQLSQDRPQGRDARRERVTIVSEAGPNFL